MCGRTIERDGKTLVVDHKSRHEFPPKLSEVTRLGARGRDLFISLK
jgi:hypothetical protein